MADDKSTSGVSIVICTHNGASRLPQALAHIAAQQDAGPIRWEVIVIDNASTDDTSAVAARCWPGTAPAPLRVIPESRLGTSYARQRGLDAARFDIVSFIDDDNLINPRWVSAVVEVMAEHPEAGACGGPLECVMEIAEPAWIQRYRDYLGIGQMIDNGCAVSVIWGAGLSVRRQAWQRMREAGFRPLTTSSQEDIEICYALRLAGWKLWLDPRLKSQHRKSAERLTWTNFLDLQRRRHAGTPDLDPYLMALGELGALPDRISGAWSYRVARTIGFLMYISLTRPHKMLAHRRSGLEGDYDVFRMTGHLGRLEGLMMARRTYRANMRYIANAPWRVPMKK